MQQLSEFLKHANYQPVFAIGIVAASLAISVVVLVLLLHTLHVLGRRTPLYKTRTPVEDWNRRFYGASALLVVVLVVLVWWLDTWRHTITP